MTIGTTLSIVTVEGNGATTTFSYPFLIPAASDALVVYTDTTGVQTQLSPTQYAITGIGSPAGGTVVYPLSGSPIATGSLLTILRSLPFIQGTSVSNQGPTFGAIENALDYLTMLTQQLQGEFSRTIQLNPADLYPAPVLPPASVRANQYLAFDSSGNPTVALGSPGSVPISAAMQPIVSAATLALAQSLLGVSPLNSVATGQFYQNNGAIVNRLNDRLLIGAATAQDGNTPEVTKTWLGQAASGEYLYLDSTSVLEVASIPGAQVSGAFGTRTSDTPVSAGASGAFGIVSYGQNDNAITGQQVWGGYFPAVALSPLAQYTLGVEADVTTTQATITVSAYDAAPVGVTSCYTAAAGGETALVSPVNPTSAAMILFPAGVGNDPIAGTGAIFQKGIVFQSNSLVGSDGNTSTFARAVEMAKGHALVWATNTGATAIGGMVRSDCLTPSLQTRVVFGASQFKVRGVANDLVTEVDLFAINPSATAVNIPALTPDSGAGTVIYGTQGVGGNVDIVLRPNGSGQVWVSNSPAIVATVPGNFSATRIIPLKDGAGNTIYVAGSTAGW